MSTRRSKLRSKSGQLVKFVDGAICDAIHGLNGYRAGGLCAIFLSGEAEKKARAFLAEKLHLEEARRDLTRLANVLHRDQLPISASDAKAERRSHKRKALVMG